MCDHQSTTDTTYNLISVTYHALQSVDTFHTYLRDAEETGDTEVTQLLTGAVQQQRDLAAQAKEILAQRLTQSGS
jgi:hypothetical protein